MFTATDCLKIAFYFPYLQVYSISKAYQEFNNRVLWFLGFMQTIIKWKMDNLMRKLNSHGKEEN